MGKTGRNDPCPCGSGRKYKRCCLGNAPERPPAASISQVHAEEAELDALSNSVLDLLRERRFDDAEKVCKRLMDQYPDQVDGLERLAMTYAARGRRREAAEYYRKAVAFMSSHDGFDTEVIADARKEAERLEAAAQDGESAGAPSPPVS